MLHNTNRDGAQKLYMFLGDTKMMATRDMFVLVTVEVILSRLFGDVGKTTLKNIFLI